MLSIKTAKTSNLYPFTAVEGATLGDLLKQAKD
jgi:hypothetical protein